MTLNEIANLLGYPYTVISACFIEAGKQKGRVAENIKEKKHKSTKLKMIDFSFEEADFAMQFLCRYTKAQSTFLKENFIERKEMYLYKNTGRAKLPLDAQRLRNLYTIRKNMKFKCCSTCVYITARKINKAGSRFSPYCNFYSCFLNKALPKRNIYRDRCETYEHSKNGPLLFTKDGIENVNYLGEVENKTLGFDNSVFTTGQTPKGEPIVLLKETEF